MLSSTYPTSIDSDASRRTLMQAPSMIHSDFRTPTRRRRGRPGLWLVLAGMLAAVSGASARQGTAAPPAQQSPPAQGQQAQQPPPRPTFRTAVNVVRVDVIVTGRDGRPVEDLAQNDFEVTEDGKPQAIETFKLVKVDGQVNPGDPEPRQIRTEYDEESEAARDDVRLYAIFLDDYHVRRTSSMSVRPALAAFIQKQLAPADLVGVMYPLMPVSAMPITRDRDKLLAAVRNFEGRKYDYQPRHPVEEQYAMYPAAVVERIRNQVTLSALESLVTRLGSLREGRKAVILVSEGFSNVLPAQLNDPIAAMPGLGNPTRRAGAIPAVGAATADSLDDRAAFFANIDLQMELRQVYDAANRNNTAIYTLDPRGLSTGEFDISQGVGQNVDRNFLQSTLDTLRTLATETDGRAIINRNDLETGLKQVVQDSSAYYLIGYNSSNTAPDGKFHEIKVRTKRPGVQLRSRKGYWALTRTEVAASLKAPSAPVPTAVTKALGSISEPRRGRYIRSWIGVGRGENGKTRVTFVWEPLPPVPGVDRTPPSAVAVQAVGPRGSYFNGVVRNDGAPGAAAPAAGGGPDGAPAVPPRPPASVTFDADPGTLQLRLAVQGERGETLDTDVRDLKVPDLTAAQVGLSTPAVFRSGNAREFQALSANPSPVATASREFRRTERLLVRFDAYGPGTEVPAVTARVLNRAGNPMVDVPVRAPQGPGGFYQLDLPLAGFAAGEYLIEVKAKGVEGEVTELVPLKITS
jgi:VWFA-related protein